MNLMEYQARALLEEAGLPVPAGEIARSREEAARIAATIGVPVVVKAQIRRGGRGKAGGVRFARTTDEAADQASSIIGSTVRGEVVGAALVVRAVEIARELYLAIAVDRAARAASIIASARGGVDIEETARTDPAAILRVPIDPLYGLADYRCREVARFLGLRGPSARACVGALHHLHRLMIERDATLIEINPLALTKTGELACLDAKVVIDDNAACRQSWLAALEAAPETPAEIAARAAGLSYIDLDGEVGCVVNGAGLAMATMDVVGLYGGRPTNFLDIGGGARAERVAAALRILFADPRVRVVLFNIFGGITRCDEVARGIVAAIGEVGMPVPIVVRLAGTAAEEGRALLAEAGIHTADSMNEAARLAVEVGRSGDQAAEVRR